MSPERGDTEHQVRPAERWPIGRAITDRIRAEVNDTMGPFSDLPNGDTFEALYLTERDGCVPDQLIGDDLHDDIRSMFYCVVDGVREELRERLQLREPLWILIEPSYEDATEFVLMTDERVLLMGGTKAWRLYWSSEDEMAKTLQNWYRTAVAGLREEPAELQHSPDGRYRVVLKLERLLHINADDPAQALDKACDWRSNEDDEDVQLEYEEVVGYRVASDVSTDERTSRSNLPSDDARIGEATME